jgi:AP-1 complex subunit beta-1
LNSWLAQLSFAVQLQVFFCKYNDPIYVKLEKLDIMIALANERNIDQVLLELKEYVTEVDVDFVRKVWASQGFKCCSLSLQFNLQSLWFSLF